MARWEPDALGRLEKAAMELFVEHGYDRTTAVEIAERAGLTERTFFRHFTDKREVLFRGSPALQKLVVDAIDAAAPATPPLDAVAAGLAAAAAMLEPRRKHAKERQKLILANKELLEREQMKMMSLGAAVAERLRARGVAEPAASLAAESGVAVFKVAFERWLVDGKKRPFTEHVQEAMAELRAVVSAPAATRRTAARDRRGP